MCAIDASLVQGRERPGGGQVGVKLASEPTNSAGFPISSRFFAECGWPAARALRGRLVGHNMSSNLPPWGRRFRTGTVASMTDDSSNNRRPHTLRGDEARQDRLKAKLRENLKRRKSQERERGLLSSDGHQDCPDGEVGSTDS